ncbi:MAG: aminodeoxychorismate synthase component I [Pontiella sp.]
MKVVLKHAGRWLHFQDPEKVLVAESVDEVLPLLQEAEESGLFAAGFISYEASPAFDHVLKTHSPDGFPCLYLGLFQAPDVLDHLEETAPVHYRIGELMPSVSRDEYTQAIHAIKEHIAAGTTYQVNYTYRLHADFEGDAWTFFGALVKGQQIEHAAYIETDYFTICSASPELFFNLSNGKITARPMKGTAKRGLTLAEDWKQAAALRASEKDRAENVMIVDMIRNDIGRVAKTGSVETVRQYEIEKYPTVWQMTSTVQGQLKSRMGTNERESMVEILQALFPCASITGAPKAKTMELIHALETSPRKIYTGSMGFMTPAGEACFNVAIRTALIEKGQLEFGVGGGIVWDSDADAEFEETLTKARVLTQPRPEFQLLETLLWEPNDGLFLMNEHVQRLAKSAAYFDVPLDMHAIMQLLEGVSHTCASVRSRIRLLVSRDGNSEIQTIPLDGTTQGSAPADGPQQPLRVALAKEPVDSENLFLYHKTTHRVVYETAKAEFPAADDVILWNECGEVTESCLANVVMLKKGKKSTPPVQCGLLAGTFRAHLLKIGAIEEGTITLEDLKSADEVWLVNSVRKWQKISLEV